MAPSSTNFSPTATASPLPYGGIIGGAVGGVIAVVLITAVAWYMVAKHRRTPVSNSGIGGPDTQIPYDPRAAMNQVS